MLKPCKCGGKPQIKREQRSYGIITGMKYAYWVVCSKCKKRTKKFSYGDDIQRRKKAIQKWNNTTCDKEVANNE